MAALELVPRTVYRAPTARRHYLTPRAAADAEARALVMRKYPTEREGRDHNGMVYDPGWHWSSDPRLVRLHKRLRRSLLRRLRYAATSHPTPKE
jgi:hypothetical protein